VTEPDAPEVLERFHAELDLVEIIARQVSRSIGSLVEYDDLLSAGREGLLNAARRFDASRGIPFRAYANFRVRGAIFDGVRQMATLPRRAYERLAALESASLFSEGDAERTFMDPVVSLEDGDVEEALEEQLAAMATATAVGVVAEARRTDPSASGDAASANPEEAFSRAELFAHVKRVLDDLESPHEATVIRLHYLEGMSMDAIGRELNIDKSWASRLHTRAMTRITKRLRGVV
jgi:RNA polymerase sigma factor for flagellar operon FliA